MVKPLYMAKSIEALQEHGKIPSTSRLNMLLKSGKTVLDAANKCFREKDEEKAYVMYMKVLTIVQEGQKTGSRTEQKEKLHFHFGKDNIKLAIERMEKLQDNLTIRYNEAYPIEEIKIVEPKKLAKKKGGASPINELKTENGIIILCKKLYSLITQKSTSYLIIDIRPKDQFELTSIDVPNIINISEEVLKTAVTADAASRGLSETSSLLWRKRWTYDVLIVCDLKTEGPPFPQSVTVMRNAILKWDPGKKYKSQPFVLSGGFELFKLMYPMLIKNPQSNQGNYQFTQTTPNDIFNFEYPDLDTGFLQSPSPAKPVKVLDSEEVPVPIINRDLKPNTTEAVTNGVSTLVEKFDSLGLMPQSNIVKTSIEIEVQPEVPCRTLKPQELLEKLKTNTINFDKERETLELTMVNEQDTLEKLKEIEETSKRKDETNDSVLKQMLNNTELKLKADVAKLKSRSEKLENDYFAISQQNQELWKVIREFLNSQDAAQMNSSLKSIIPPQKEETELIERNRKIQDLNKGVEHLRKERKEKEVRIAQQKESNMSEKATEVIKSENINKELSPRSRPVERHSKLKTQVNVDDKNTGSRRRGDTYTTNLKSSPRVSPNRSGTNLRRSHSAINIAKLNDNDLFESSVMPSFDRRLKPMESPQKRTVIAARQRNFEAKIGIVGRGKTGLKNLGNTCYMNSVIQCLNNTIPLAQFFMNNSYSDNINENSKQRGMVAEEMAAVIRALWGGHYKSFSMWDLKNVISKHHKPFHGCDQHDSHEFLLMLMNWLNDDLNTIKVPPVEALKNQFEDVPDNQAAEKVTMEMNRREKSIVRTLFHGLQQSVITCTACDNRSITFDQFGVLSVPLPTNGTCSLEEVMRNYYKTIEIEFKCDRCKKTRICNQKINIWQLPPVLIIHLSRFEQDVLTKKNPNLVDFPLENLDLSRYVVSSNNQYDNFNLYACSNHFGTMDGGHYTAYCHSKTFGWLKFDDNEVYELPTKSVKTPAAYILFYQADNFNSI